MRIPGLKEKSIEESKRPIVRYWSEQDNIRETR